MYPAYGSQLLCSSFLFKNSCMIESPSFKQFLSTIYRDVVSMSEVHTLTSPSSFQSHKRLYMHKDVCVYSWLCVCVCVCVSACVLRMCTCQEICWAWFSSVTIHPVFFLRTWWFWALDLICALWRTTINKLTIRIETPKPAPGCWVLIASTRTQMETERQAGRKTGRRVILCFILVSLSDGKGNEGGAMWGWRKGWGRDNGGDEEHIETEREMISLWWFNPGDHVGCWDWKFSVTIPKHTSYTSINSTFFIEVSILTKRWLHPTRSSLLC